MAKDFKLKPLEDRIIVQPSEAEETTASGLVIPDTAKEKPVVGTVVAVGPGKFNEDGDARVPVDVAVSRSSAKQRNKRRGSRTRVPIASFDTKSQEKKEDTSGLEAAEVR